MLFLLFLFTVSLVVGVLCIFVVILVVVVVVVTTIIVMIVIVITIGDLKCLERKRTYQL